MIYLDNAATTRPCAEAVAAVNDALTARWGNPSAVHRLGIEAARAAAHGPAGCRRGHGRRDGARLFHLRRHGGR